MHPSDICEVCKNPVWECDCEESRTNEDAPPDCWGHRVVRHVEDDYEWYAIHEVYYSRDGHSEATTQDPVTIEGDTPEELRKIYEEMAEAFGAPILDLDSFGPGEDAAS